MPHYGVPQGTFARATDNDRPRCYDSIAMANSRISLDQVRHVALLARLELSDLELERLRADMDEMLAYVEKLGELDTSSVEPTTQVGEAGAPTRRDEVTNGPAAGEMLSNAPSVERGYFKVPKIIE
jgi:aspartyl-tRNA(Asn)/glutamyl-tRNA(Gln) amidotransferase subunit C